MQNRLFYLIDKFLGIEDKKQEKAILPIQPPVPPNTPNPTPPPSPKR